MNAADVWEMAKTWELSDTLLADVPALHAALERVGRTAPHHWKYYLSLHKVNHYDLTQTVEIIEEDALHDMLLGVPSREESAAGIEAAGVAAGVAATRQTALTIKAEKKAAQEAVRASQLQAKKQVVGWALLFLSAYVVTATFAPRYFEAQWKARKTQEAAERVFLSQEGR